VSGYRADVRRGFAVATGAMVCTALVELLVTLFQYAGPLRVSAVAQLIPLDLTLWALVWVPVVLIAGGLFALPRLLVRVARGTEAARAMPGLGAKAAAPRTVTRVAAALLCALIFELWTSRTMLHGFETYKDKKLAALLLSIEQVAMIALLVGLFAVLVLAFDALRRLLERHVYARHGWIAYFDPLSEPVALLMFSSTILIITIAVMVTKQPYLRPLVPWRLLTDVGAAVIGAVASLVVLRQFPIRVRRRRRAALIAAGTALVLVPVTLLWLGGDRDAKGMAISASPALEKMIASVRWANDLDRDGFGSLLGENDCAPLDAKIHPGARDVPDDGIDQNCNGHDSSLRDLVAPAGEKMPVPEAFQRDWNILLITIDATRYDHTSFGGYDRDTTPRLQELVDRAVSFTFANAPSAGTMASVPAIITSKFFHSGIALDENRKKGMPPKLKPENTTLPEIMKRGGYTTGVILSHEYFNDWGMEQGVDDYDNTIGKKPDADRVSSDQSTARSLAWITRHTNKKWFLWVHYLDPHGHYVAHPDGPQWSGPDSEMDHYDQEIRYTDEYLGKLFDDLARTGAADNTIIIITSDHGDAFNEHGTRNHGDTLYGELLHVPLIIAVPDLPPRRVDGAVTPLDIVPTVADLCGIDVSDLSFEGRSLVPQIFYGKEDPERVVFAETNFQHILRAAISERYKMIFDLKNNQYKLFDLEADPGEKKDISGKDKDGFATMQEQLQAWIDRVVFARDPDANQVLTKLQGILLDAAPKPAHTVEGVTLDEGRIEVIGYEGTIEPGKKQPVTIYFHVKERPSAPFKLQAQLTQGQKVAKSSSRTTADGYFPTDQWRPGDYIRDTFPISVPAEWGLVGGDVGVGVSLQGQVVAELGPLALPVIPSVDAGVPSPGGSAPLRP
jgi:arylsulfatase A-like enzyme